MFRPVHVDLGKVDQLFHNRDRIFKFCAETELADQIQSVLCMAGIADVVAVFTVGMGGERVSADGAFHGFLMIQIDEGSAADQAFPGSI